MSAFSKILWRWVLSAAGAAAATFAGSVAGRPSDTILNFQTAHRSFERGSPECHKPVASTQANNAALFSVSMLNCDTGISPVLAARNVGNRCFYLSHTPSTGGTPRVTLKHRD